MSIFWWSGVEPPVPASPGIGARLAVPTGQLLCAFGLRAIRPYTPSMPSSTRPVVAVAGATGFVGEFLLKALKDTHRVIGLTRSPTRAAQKDDSGVEWRHCDLFSIAQVDHALKGVDYAIYLVHSMLPNARLTQASFLDLDVLLADNFARAAEANGVKQILYLGGIRPEGTKLSPHLRSRLEVEAVLSGRQVPTTALRAGLIVGPGGSSMRMLVNLVRRLPVMVLPSWTASESAPIAIDDVVRAIQRCLGDADTYDRHFDLGGPEAMSYREMMKRAAVVLGTKRPMLDTPFFSPRLSTAWVATFTGASRELVGPLVASLEHSVVPEPNWLNSWLLESGPRTFEDALERAVREDGQPVENPRSSLVKSDKSYLREAATVRSVQRLPLPKDTGAAWATDEYMRWIPRFMWPFLNVTVEGSVVEFKVRLFGTVLLQLRHRRDLSGRDRQFLEITGGVLAKVGETHQGRLEFREVNRGRALIAAIHDFQPRLPWYVYNLSQALVHLLVMRAFGFHLSRVGGPGSTQPLLPRSSTISPPAPETPPESAPRLSAPADQTQEQPALYI